MKDSEEAIEKVLAGLRAAEAPVGMELRVLQAMEQRAAAGARGWLAAGWVVAGGLVAAGVLGMAIRVAHRPLASVAGTHVSGSQYVPLAVDVCCGSRPHPSLDTKARRMGHPDPLAVAARRRANAGVLRFVQDDVSLVAPPMPLTEQEKLLLRVARRGEPEAVPVLDPDGLARQEAQTEAEFQQTVAQSAEVEQLGRITMGNGERR